MTLVLGACATDAVVLGADSKIQVHTFDGYTGPLVKIEPGVGRKLFRIGRAGVAVHGIPLLGVDVPTVIYAEQLHSQINVMEVMHWLQARFKGADHMHALVGGWDDQGEPALFDVCMSGAEPFVRLPRQPAWLVLRGTVTEQRDQRPPGTSGSVIAQMLDVFAEHRGNPNVGPPYEFLVIPHTTPALKDDRDP
jgi:hypothetical protein